MPSSGDGSPGPAGEEATATHTSPKDDVPLEEVLEKLGASRDGLSQEEAERRLERFGPNELAEVTVHPILKLLSYFWGPIPWMIEAAAILSALVRHWEDFAIITVLLVMNAGVGFWEEFQAGNAIAALKARLAPRARVRRDGAWKTVPARELVPGDVVRLRIGEVVPADARLFAGDPVQVDQSALTGESLPVERGEGQTVYSSSIVKRGEIEALVQATGSETYFGRTARLVQQAHVVSHFQRAVLKIGDYLIVIAVALVALILAVALFRGDPMLTTLEFALVLTVAAVPVAMPAVLSVTMAVGARLLARKEAIVSRLASIEELAGADVLCSDKTGTLTENRLTLGAPFCLEGVEPVEVVQAGALASRAEDEDPIDLAVLSGVGDGETPAGEVVRFQPFDPVHKRTEAEVRGPGGQHFSVSKGAPQVILDLVQASDTVRSTVGEAVDGFAARGFRSLGVARSDEGRGWRYLGVLPLFDPPREDSRETVETAASMGVAIKMVTGDQIAIARETARKLGLGTNILDASLFEDTKHHQGGALATAIEEADGFAQVFPEHKFHIVDVLQQREHIVGMTGDGVNDAPALKEADAGIAVSGATDAARAAADIVLLAPGLSVIVDAIKESRKIFQRMNSYAVYRIAETVRVLLFMTLAILVFDFYPVTAVMIVLLALLNDGAILSIAYDRVRYSDEPERWNMREVLGVATILGIAGVVASFGLFYIGERVLGLGRDTIQSLIYLKLSVAGHLTIFVTRTRKAFWSVPPAPILLGAVVVTQIVATLIAVYGILMPPLGWRFALLVWGYALAWFLVNDRVKLAAYHLLDPSRSGLFGGRSRRSESGTRG
ncbi:MAG: plasma-membrane proton-efflux P-type ATPase [Gemmatimonadota bacterium]